MREGSNGRQCRVVKNNNYTTISNICLRNKELSLKAKGLLTVCLSLPDDWDYSIAGLVTLSSDGRDSVTNALKELEKLGFLNIEKSRIKGTFARFYTFYENPDDNPLFNKVLAVTGFPLRCGDRDGFSDTVNPMQMCRDGSTETDNPEQINTNNKVLKLNTNTNKKQQRKEKEKISFGEFSNVFLTQEEILKLKELYKTEEKFNEGITILSNYKASSGKKYKSDYAVLNRSNWVYKKIFPIQQEQTVSNSGKYSKCYG